MKFKKLVSVYIFMLAIIFGNSVNAAYIELATGIGGKDMYFNTKSLGADYYLGIGIISYQDYTFGVGGNLNIKGFGTSPFAVPENIANKISEIGSGNANNKKNDFDSLSSILVANNSVYSAAYFTVNINHLFGETSNFYAIAGLGYGAHYTVKPNSKNVVEVASSLSELNGNSSPQEIENIVNDPVFISNLQALANDPALISSLLNGLYPGFDFSSIVSQIDSADKINNLANNSGERENFVTDVNNFVYDNNLNLSDINLNASRGINIACDSLLDCRKGVAYQLGVGYDLKLISIIHLDMFAKMNGLFAYKPIYSAGAGLKFKF